MQVMSEFYLSPRNTLVVAVFHLQVGKFFADSFFFQHFSNSPWRHSLFLTPSLHALCYFQKLPPICQAVCICIPNTHSTYNPLHRPPPPLSVPLFWVIPSLLCAMPTSRGCPPVLLAHTSRAKPHLVITGGWSPLDSEGLGQAGDCNDQKLHWQPERHCGTFWAKDVSIKVIYEVGYRER